MIIKNFLFHRVSDNVDSLWPPMRPGLFEKIVKKLSKQYHVLNLETYLKEKETFENSSKQIATILFDDGYKDNIEYAAPILEKYNCPASFYVVTDCIDRNIPTWTYIFDFTLQNTRVKQVNLDFIYVPELFRKMMLHNDVSNPAKKLKPWMKTLGNSRRLQILQTVLDQCNDIQIPNDQMMSWNDVQQLRNGGYSIGSHTDTHPMLAQLEDINEIAKELQTSFSKITAKLGITPDTISYPIGSYDKRVVELSQEAGYKFGLAVEQCFYNTGKHTKFSIPRVELYQEPLWKVNARMNGVYNALKKVWK